MKDWDNGIISFQTVCGNAVPRGGGMLLDDHTSLITAILISNLDFCRKKNRVESERAAGGERQMAKL